MLPIALALAQFAPQIAQWIGGSRAEQVAQKVVTIAQTVTGTSTPEQALAAIQANPELAYQFQESIVESQVELQRIAAELEKAHITANIETAKVNAADRANARQMALTAEDRTPRNLAYLYIGVLFLVIGAHFRLLFSRIPVEPLTFGVLGKIKGPIRRYQQTARSDHCRFGDRSRCPQSGCSTPARVYQYSIVSLKAIIIFWAGMLSYRRHPSHDKEDNKIAGILTASLRSQRLFSQVYDISKASK
ncbi:hypothetical protein [Mycetohabitans rhizoxinica]|uniref:hypothetical protein n=1 Tax=Mycetohabitans rhizoxinica TaxID=412963 RepID=UPI0030D5661D